jgi:hypothetical protein
LSVVHLPHVTIVRDARECEPGAKFKIEVNFGVGLRPGMTEWMTAELAKSLRQKSNLASRFNADFTVQPPCENISLSLSGKSPLEARAIPPFHKGRFAIVTDVGRGMRWTLWREGRTRAKRTAKSYGPGTPTLVSSSSEADASQG